MTTTAPTPARASAPARRPPFDPLIVTLHWASLLLVAGLFVSALSLGQVQDAAGAARLLLVHRSLGAALWTLTALRLAWRATGAVLPAFPATMSPVHQLAARLSEYGLYGLLLVQPLTGLAQSLYRGKAFDLWFWTVPRLVDRNKVLVHLLGGVHEWGAWALAGLIGLHAAAGLFHGLVLRDGVLQSMWPSNRRKADA